MDANFRDFEAELEELLFDDDRIREYRDPLMQKIVV